MIAIGIAGEQLWAQRAREAAGFEAIAIGAVVVELGQQQRVLRAREARGLGK